MRVIRLLQVLAVANGIRAAPNEDASSRDVDANNIGEDDNFDDLVFGPDALNYTYPEGHLEKRAGPALILGRIAYNLIVNAATGLFVGEILNSEGGSTAIVNLSDESINGIATLVKQTVEEAWYTRDKTDAQTFLQLAGNYARRGAYNSSNPDPAQFSIIDQDRQLASSYASTAHGLLNRIDTYGLKGAPLYQVLLGTWVSFNREYITLAQMLDTINEDRTTLAQTATLNFRTNCKVMHDVLVAYRDYYDNRVPRLYFDTRFVQRDVSNHLIKCRRTVERRYRVEAFKQAQYSEAERDEARADPSTWDLDYFRISDPPCRANRCNPSSAAKACYDRWNNWAADLYRSSVERWRVRRRTEFLTGEINKNIQAMLSLHDGSTPV
ncbi:hypothetical protein DL764_008903 [Monosporascus ibericus]|uniref:Uncharacterized protein n=1 Tax=Monosporascus ibericus TaxID=155417 RepID=A0A4Q4SZB7_9PEZI|nr:hypothetical protein DL764_008903 [Monosporascus ibericus]